MRKHALKQIQARISVQQYNNHVLCLSLSTHFNYISAESWILFWRRRKKKNSFLMASNLLYNCFTNLETFSQDLENTFLNYIYIYILI